ncbi:beta-ketoacyl-[acyl-carrier-protein] synthase family protein [Burkholderia stabilis]|uniref:beta-ketoacyl-[acyl-carrier-protein] synthase family protein n=1 Tax=Burkholderia stabilis TaxID=95485 RepID=UPI001589B388|nr:beta-ketoacyl-[acyl-carrier-protein] synthase family protein [Burkholderia stabilis]
MSIASPVNANSRRRVVITGYGCVTPLGNDAAECWDSIVNYRCGYRALDTGDASIYAKFFGKVDIDDKRFRCIPAAVRRALPRFARYAALAANEAIEMAFGHASPAHVYAPTECGVIVGTGWGGLDEAYECHDLYLGTGLGSPLGSLLTMPNVATAACSLIWDLRGYQNTPVAACATGTIAIGDAAEIIRSGRAKMMLAGGAEALNSRTNIWNVDILQALSKEQSDVEKACCPFSKARSGFVLSEGAAVVCLEDFESAVRRGAHILGEVTGYGSYSDARDFTAPAEDMVARVASIHAALRDARIDAKQIDYVNAHGTSTPLNDENETSSIKQALGSAAYRIPVSSTKSYSGHLIAAAGSFETIVCLKTIETGLVPATIHLNEPDPACDLDYVPNCHRQAQVNIALNLSFGFGGANAALLLERCES